jgi:hypothetical protein
MENVIVVPANDALATELAAARLGAAEAQRAAYGANTRYAVALNQVFAFDWFDLSGTDTSDEGKQVRKEKGMFFEALKAINPEHTNPSTIWARIRSVAKLQRYPAPAKVSAEAGETTEAEQGESGAKHNRSPLTRNIEDLSTLFKFNQRQENLEDKVKRANTKIAEALRELGVDISLLNAK